MLGVTFANYKIMRLIKSGGMADVYEGIDIYTAEKVAVKILKSDFKNDHDVVRRFYIEGAVLEKFDHPNIVKFLFNTDIDGQPVMVMEYLEGFDMNDLLNRNEPLDFKLISDYFIQVLDAVIYAHSKNVVHRDIKPSNIFITNQGEVKLLDFGIAKILLDNVDQTKTGFGQFTPTYMSPEQATMKKEITEKSDIYSLGITLYTLLNGKNPYQGMSAFEIGHHVIHEPLPALNGFNYVNDVITKATAKSLGQRYNSVQDFKNDLLGRLTNDKKNGDDLNIGSRIVVSFSIIILLIIFTFIFSVDNKKTDFLNNNEEVTPTQEFIPINLRFLNAKGSKYEIIDTQLNCKWLIIDHSVSFYEAKNEVNSNYKIPTFDDISTLFDKDKSAGTGYQKGSEFYPAHMDPIFSAVGSGSWFWVSDRHPKPDKAYAINMFTGDKVVFDKKNPSFPVYLILKMDL